MTYKINTTLSEQFNNIIEKIRERGTFDTITHKYITDNFTIYADLSI